MIIGNGVIAEALRGIEVPQEVVVHAAGVSNSLCENPAEFNRDIKRIDLTLKLSKKVIYFSSQGCVNLKNSIPYYEHKRFIENKILCNSDKHLIVRLPQFCSRTVNPKNLLSSLFLKLQNNETVTCYRNVSRNLITDEHLQKIFHLLLSTNLTGLRSFCSPYDYKPIEIISEIERYLSVTADVKFSDNLIEKFPIKYENSDEFVNAYSEMQKIGRSDYLSHVIKHVFN